MTALALAAAWTAVCLAWALAYPRAVAAAGASSWADSLSEELRSARDDRERVVAVNDALRDLEHDLDARARLPLTAAWLAVTGSVLALIAGLLHRPELELLGCLAIAVVGAAGCVAARRLGRRRARAVRLAIDEQVRGLVGDLYDAEVVLVPGRGARRRRASSR